MFFAETGLPQPEKSSEQSDKKEVAEQEAPSPKKTEEAAQEPDKQLWPPPFVPSEKVGADSVISFPTDI